MKVVRLGAVNYLNARPLVYGLELRSDLFSLRFDVPSKCAALLHEGSIDVGMIPSIEYLRGDAYRIAPGIGIVSEGPVASVALFTTTPVGRIRTIAADTSSRTSHVLLRILCLERFGIDPEFQPMAPEPELMLRRCDAALLIGDPALFLDHERLGIESGSRRSLDVDDEMPFVWRFGRAPGGLPPAGVSGAHPGARCRYCRIHSLAAATAARRAAAARHI